MIASPLEIEIKTINLKNRKLTKSIFNQIELKSCFDKQLDFIGDKFFGYIKDKDKRYLIWSYKEQLRKTDLKKYFDLRKADPDSIYVARNTKWLLKDCDIEHVVHGDDNGGEYKIEIDSAGLIKYNSLVDKVRKFNSELLNYQLYI